MYHNKKIPDVLLFYGNKNIYFANILWQIDQGARCLVIIDVFDGSCWLPSTSISFPIFGYANLPIMNYGHSNKFSFAMVTSLHIEMQRKALLSILPLQSPTLLNMPKHTKKIYTHLNGRYPVHEINLKHSRTTPGKQSLGSSY